jgi:hypothetical protein
MGMTIKICAMACPPKARVVAIGPAALIHVGSTAAWTPRGVPNYKRGSARSDDRETFRAAIPTLGPHEPAKRLSSAPQGGRKPYGGHSWRDESDRRPGIGGRSQLEPVQA